MPQSRRNIIAGVRELVKEFVGARDCWVMILEEKRGKTVTAYCTPDCAPMVVNIGDSFDTVVGLFLHCSRSLLTL
jgi:hypothetical protein